jgi:hypothetical protein
MDSIPRDYFISIREKDVTVTVVLKSDFVDQLIGKGLSLFRRHGALLE